MFVWIWIERTNDITISVESSAAAKAFPVESFFIEILWTLVDAFKCQNKYNKKKNSEKKFPTWIKSKERHPASVVSATHPWVRYNPLVRNLIQQKSLDARRVPVRHQHCDIHVVVDKVWQPVHQWIEQSVFISLKFLFFSNLMFRNTGR